jgi:hypothetical protein
VIVHGLIRPLCRFAANRIEVPVDLIQVDIRRQRTERPPLGNADWPANLDDLFDEV